MESGDEGLVNEKWIMKTGVRQQLLPQPTEGGDEIFKWETKGEIHLLVESDLKVHFREHEDDCLNAYDDLFSIRKQDLESLVDLGVRIEKAIQAIQNLRPVGFTIEQLDEELQCMALVLELPLGNRAGSIL